MFWKKYDFLEKFLINYQMVYLDYFLCIKNTWILLIIVINNITMNQYYFCNFKMWYVFTIFVLSYFIFSASKQFHCFRCKSWRWYPVLILDVIVFSILFTYIFIDIYLHIFLYIHIIPCWTWYFKFVVIVWAFFVFPCVTNTKIR